MLLYSTNETGYDIFIIYPEEVSDGDEKLELRLQLHNSSPPKNFGIKQLRQLPWCATFDLADISAEELEIDLRPSGNFKIEWKYGPLPDECPECRMLRILKIIPTSFGN